MELTILLAFPGGTEWLLILVIVLLFFGGKKLPGLMRGLGRSVREFNEAKSGKANKDDDNKAIEPDTKEVKSNLEE